MGNGDNDTLKPMKLLFAAVAALWLPTGAFAQMACEEGSVALRGDWGAVRLSVEIADDPDELRQGLMYRESLPTASGMLFIYPQPRPASFWMRNTLIPLDMLFIDRRGVVTHIHRNAVPLDETSIFGGEEVLAVLEINGGLSERLGIDEGTQLRHPAFDANGAAWPCQ